MAGILEEAVGCARDIVFDVFQEDTKVEVSVTYSGVSKTTYNPVTDVNDSVVVSETITVIKTPVSAREVEQNENILMGDIKFLARISDFATLTPDTFKQNDTITEGSEVFDVIFFKAEPTQQLAIFFARRVVG